MTALLPTAGYLLPTASAISDAQTQLVSPVKKKMRNRPVSIRTFVLVKQTSLTRTQQLVARLL
jgi:hypothetical protein